MDETGRYTFCEKLKAFFYHLKMMLFAKGEERDIYVHTFKEYIKWKANGAHGKFTPV